MPVSHRVLVVDRLSETREVLRIAFARRGIDILEARDAKDGLQLARRHHPDVIVLDLELDPAAPDTVSRRFEAEAGGGRTRFIVLGTARRRDPCAGRHQYVSKPYDYGPLIRKIEELLADSSPRR